MSSLAQKDNSSKLAVYMCLSSRRHIDIPDGICQKAEHFESGLEHVSHWEDHAFQALIQNLFAYRHSEGRCAAACMRHELCLTCKEGRGAK